MFSTHKKTTVLPKPNISSLSLKMPKTLRFLSAVLVLATVIIVPGCRKKKPNETGVEENSKPETGAKMPKKPAAHGEGGTLSVAGQAYDSSVKDIRRRGNFNKMANTGGSGGGAGNGSGETWGSTGDQVINNETNFIK
jgi:hypothetical protein